LAAPAVTVRPRRLIVRDVSVDDDADRRPVQTAPGAVVQRDNDMKIHEYQAKAILAKYGVPVPEGEVVQTPADAAGVARRLGGGVSVVKAQIHAGGRGKGGGVKVVKSPDEAERAAGQILGMTLVTYQTGPRGQKVAKVLVEQGLQAVHKGQVAIANMTWGSSSIPDISASTGHFFIGTPDDLSQDKEVTDLINQANGTIDPDKRKATLHKALQKIAAEAYWVPMFSYAKFYAYSKALDFKATSDEIPQFYKAKWK
jgi:succinyl-CoA synthetase beta subunit